MANPSWFGSSQNRNIIANSNTTYWPLWTTEAANPATIEASVQSIFPAGVASRLGVFVSTNTRSTSTTIRLRKNGAAGSCVIVVGAGVTGWIEDTTNTDTIAENDALAVQVVTSTGGGDFTFQSFTIKFEPTSGGAIVPMARYRGSSNVLQYNGTPGQRYSTIPGANWLSAFDSVHTTALGGHVYHVAGVAKKLQVYISQNTRSTSTTIKIAINGVDGASSITVGAGVTGLLSDLTNSDAISPGDIVSASVLGSSTGNLEMAYIGFIFQSDDSSWPVMHGRGNQILTDDVEYFVAGVGRASSISTETTVIQYPPFDIKVSDLRVIYDLFSSTYDSICGLRKNGATTSLVVSVDTVTTEFTNFVDDEVYTPSDSISVLTGMTDDFHRYSTIVYLMDSDTGTATDMALPVGLNIAEGFPLRESTNMQLPVGLNIAEGFPLYDDTVFTSQAPVIAIGEGDADARISQAAIIALAEIYPEAHISQAAILALAEIYPPVNVSQAAVIVIADSSPCVTQRCQLWKITRRDGEVFTYTSHDHDITYMGDVYRSCHSLTPTASESASSLESVANMDLSGIVDDDAITEAALYGGLFDDAYVEVWLYTWGDYADTPKRLAAGWTGAISHSDRGFQTEVLGPSSRLGQQALVTAITPGCRWIFGSPQCGVDIEALAIPGVVLSSFRRDVISVELDGVSSDSFQSDNGSVRFSSGANDGITAEVKTVDFDTGIITLWDGLAFIPEYGDTFDLLPGCDKTKPTCKDVYDNFINFGGFPDMPGEDSVTETPEAKY